jgi:membrane protein
MARQDTIWTQTHATVPRWRGHRLAALCRRATFEFMDDNCLGIAAQLAFYFLLALFPALLVIVAALSFVPGPALFDDALAALDRIAPPDVLSLLRGQLAQITGGDHTGVVTLGVLGALWSSSAAMVALIDGLNRAYDVIEWRAWWKRRLVAIALTIVVALFTILAFALVAAGPQAIASLAAWWAPARVFEPMWQALRWPLLLAFVIAGVDLVYYIAPNRTVAWSWITPGAAVATLLWLAVSFGFKAYVIYAADYAATYGAIGGVIVTMLWFYLSGLALLVGAELNAVLEEAR